MRRVLCPKLPSPQQPVPFEGPEANHALNVLRLGDGDRVVAMDGQGNAVVAILRVAAARGAGARLEFGSALRADEAGGDGAGSDEAGADGRVSVVLELALLKGEAMQWAIEKSVELGVDALAPVLAEHSVVQVKSKGPEAFRERWQKIADQALKQCGRLKAMRVRAPVSLAERLRESPAGDGHLRLWCDEKLGGDAVPQPSVLLEWLVARLGKSNFRKISVLIGPEGGWSAGERETLSRLLAQGVHPVSLGKLILRAETAALHAVSLVTACAALDKAALSKGD